MKRLIAFLATASLALATAPLPTVIPAGAQQAGPYWGEIATFIGFGGLGPVLQVLFRVL
jgi:hypothetical protein